MELKFTLISTTMLLQVFFFFFSIRMHRSFLLLQLRLSNYELIVRSRQDNTNGTFDSYPSVGLQEAAFLWPRGRVLHTMQDAKIMPLD